MKLHEYQSKKIFEKYGVPIPKGRVAATAGEARAIADELGGRVVIKSQVLVGGRGKAGGIRLAKDSEEAEEPDAPYKIKYQGKWMVFSSRAEKDNFEKTYNIK